MNTPIKAAPKSTQPLLALLCFTLLAGLTILKTEEWDNVVIISLTGLFLGFVMLTLFSWILSLFNPQITQQHGRKSISWIVNRSFLLLIPFTVLAFIATIDLGWYVTNAFVSAGIMTSSTAIGAELTRLGGGAVRSVLLPALGGLVITTIWMLTLSGLAAILQG